LKSVWKDKFCMMSFLLPVGVALALNSIGGIDLSSVAEFQFGVLESDLSARTISWLERYGSVTAYRTQEALIAAINEPSTYRIGVVSDGEGIQTMVSGDELDLFRQTADTLPVLYAGREYAGQVSVNILERPDLMAGFQNIFPAMTVIVAMFMGCTFNAMNVITEKENGVDLVNQILPVTQSGYAVQKIFVGFTGGCLSAILTACCCFRLQWESAVLMLVLIMLSAFIAALIGLLIGKFSESLMVGVVYIKIAMIIFIAVPLVSYLLAAGGLVAVLCYFVPSSAAFEGIMNLADSDKSAIAKDILILMAHCFIWFVLYLSVSRWQKKHLRTGL
ncbi:MAG: ABC transporter permease, partial [Lachnospiraceae bacterium]|nr:ABC transporter permease [Lachnospiraceae bacterium]